MDCCKQDATVKKVIAVVGATGAQGGGLVKAILDDPKGGFTARALTRDPTKDKAVALKKQGAEVVQFDMDDPSTHADAFKGAYGVFVVTNYWEHFSVEKEKAQAKSVADACEAAGVKHIVWSTLEGTNDFFDSLPEEERPNKIDGYYVPHFEGKHESDWYFPVEKTTDLYASFYLENFSGMGMIQDGVMCNNMGDSPLPVIAVEDIGKCAYGVFKAGDKYKGENVYIAGDVLPCKTLMEIAWDVTGQEFEYQGVDRETYAGFDFPGANDIANMFYFKVKNTDFVNNRDPNKARELNPELLHARAWMEKNSDAMSKLAKPVSEAAVSQETPVQSNKKAAPQVVDETSESYHGEELWA